MSTTCPGSWHRLFVIVTGMLLPLFWAAPSAAALAPAQADDRIPTSVQLETPYQHWSACCPIPLRAWPQPANLFYQLKFLIDGKPTTHILAGEGTHFAHGIPPGSHEIVAVFEGNATHAPSRSAPAMLTVEDTSPRQQYFAEGATGFFQTRIGILNVGGATAPVRVDL